MSLSFLAWQQVHLERQQQPLEQAEVLHQPSELEGV